jgi:hypothetical protein
MVESSLNFHNFAQLGRASAAPEAKDLSGHLAAKPFTGVWAQSRITSGLLHHRAGNGGTGLFAKEAMFIG